MSEIVQQVVTQQQLEQSHSAAGLFRLPCGYTDEEGQLHVDVELREITGVEEDVLLGKGGSGFDKLNTVLANCVVRVGTIVDRRRIPRIVEGMRTADRSFLLLALRRVSLGDRYPFQYQCPACKAKNVLELDLSELDIVPTVDPDLTEFSLTLPSKRVAVVRAMTGHLEKMLEQNSKKGKGQDRMSRLLLARVSKLDDEDITLAALKGLTTRDRNALREFFDRIDGGVDTTVEVECPSCGDEDSVEVTPTDSGFFFPSSVRRTSRTKSST